MPGPWKESASDTVAPYFIKATTGIDLRKPDGDLDEAGLRVPEEMMAGSKFARGESAPSLVNRTKYEGKTRPR